MPPLERIFGALGVTKSELLGFGKQIGLMEALQRNGNGVKEEEKEPEIAKEVPKADMTGFICQKCSEFYERPPLIGTCRCGGMLAISSKKGPALAVA